MTEIYYPPAFCPTHGLFAATNMGISGNANVSFTGCITSCPTCNFNSEVIPGEYQLTPDSLNVLIDPTISTEALAALKQIAERLQKNEITPEEAAVSAEKITPGSGKLFAMSEWGDQAKAIVAAAIITAIGAVTSADILAPSNSPAPTPSVIERSISDLKNSTALSQNPGYIPVPSPRRSKSHKKPL